MPNLSEENEKQPQMINIFRQYLQAGTSIAEEKSTSRVVETFRILLYRIVTGYGLDMYLTYAMQDKPVNFKEWRTYLDKRDFCTLLFRYNKKELFGVLEDKVSFSEACLRHQLPHPEVLFTCNYSGQNSLFTNYEKGSTATGFANLAQGEYIVKTCGGSYGINLWSIEKIGDDIQVHNLKQRQTVQQFASLLEQNKDSYLVQKKITVARSLHAIMPGLGCGTMRIMTFRRPDGTVGMPYYFIKLTTNASLSDNFSGNSWGNMLAMINTENHCISLVVAKATNGLYRKVTHHPDTDADLRNYPVPEIQQALDLGRQCALAFPDIPAVGWDVVITDQGAMVLEGNPMFDPIGPQLCADCGIRDIVPRLLEGKD